eukprot:scaffold167_cov110-Cylindrotheca_fusiformis.AAC.25
MVLQETTGKGDTITQTKLRVPPRFGFPLESPTLRIGVMPKAWRFLADSELHNLRKLWHC